MRTRTTIDARASVAKNAGTQKTRAKGGKAQTTGAPASNASLAVFVASFCLYAMTSSPAIGWLDSPEFVAQAATLGVAHSPGHPLPALLGRLLGLVPIGDLVWRVNLASALCAAGATAMLFCCLRETFTLFAPRISAKSGRALAIALALVAATSWALWSNAVRAEVYALQSLLSVGALYALIRFQQTSSSRWVLTATFWLALGLANHHLLALTIVFPAILFVLIRPDRPPRIAYIGAVGMGVLGLSALLYLPIRSLAHPLVNFGAPHTLERFVWTLRGAAFSKSVNLDHVSSPALDAAQVTMAIGSAVTIPLLLFALYAAATGGRSNASRGLIHLLSGIVLLAAAARVLLGFDPEVPDHHAYLMPAIIALYLLAAAGIAQLLARALDAERPLPKAPALAAIALALLVPIQTATQWSRSSQQNAWASDDVAHWELEGLPSRTLLLQAYFHTSFRAWALRSVEGHRPDIVYLDRSFLTYPGMRDEAALQYPELTALLDAPLVAGTPSPVALLRELDRARPVRVQMHPNVDPALAQATSPSGAWAGFSGGAGSDAKARKTLMNIFESAAPSEASEARGALLWHDATRLDHLCIIGERAWAQRVLDQALALAPTDLMLAEMAKRCGLRMQ